MTKTALRRLLGSGLAIAASAYGSQALAQVPQSITQQGRLYDANGQPITGPLDVAFSLYTSAGAATPIWSETHTITFDEGYFSVTLGTTDPIDTTVLDGSVRHLGIKVGTDPEMTPRAEVHSVPYAILAGDVTGDIHPNSIIINGTTVIDDTGAWVGGSSGLIGPTGPAGADGADGALGPTGPAGADGALGPTGPAGANGAIGPTGPAGAKGATGATGAAGATGAVGPTGPQGTVGAVGPTGPAGANGAVGAVGPTGPAGANGAVGAVGPTGPAGANGAVGAVGPTGPAGAKGATGATGATGAFAAPAATDAIFGVGPITHYTGTGWVLDSPDATTFRLRTTDATGYFLTFTHPTGCVGGTGSTNMAQTHKLTSTAGDSLSASTCGPGSSGSTVYITVRQWLNNNVGYFRCWQSTSNHNSCQRLLP